MLFGLVLVLHILVSLVLIGVILLQGGRGGLSDALGGTAAQSLFGGGVATVLTKITGACAGIFMVTCLSLAYLSTMRGRSVIEQMPLMAPEHLPAALPSAHRPMPSSTPDNTEPHETAPSTATSSSSATSDAKPAAGTPTAGSTAEPAQSTAASPPSSSTSPAR